MASSTLLTADELLRMSFPGKRVELVRGTLVVSEPPGFLHGECMVRLARILGDYVASHDLGRVVAGDSGFKLASDPDTVRGPDVAFVQKGRIPDPPPVGYAELAPDLAVEVLSPRDRPGETLAKVGDWLNAGTRLVWVVNPERRTARVYRADGSETLVETGAVLDGEDVVPGFACPLSSIA